jgi:DNA repair protein RecO (recombination protein O)
MNALSEEFHAAFILYVKPYQETSALVETFCREHGRVGMVFRRVRGSKSGKGALLQPFQPLWVSYTGHHELRSGRQIEARGPSVWLTGTPLISGLYLNELLVRLLHRDDPHPGLFDAYETTLQALLVDPVEPCLRQFERRLLAELGYEINFHEDTEGVPLQQGRRYRFLPESGFAVQYGATQQTDFEGAELLLIAASQYEEAVVRRTAKRLFRMALAAHLGNKPLMSRALFNTHSVVK